MVVVVVVVVCGLVLAVPGVVSRKRASRGPLGDGGVEGCRVAMTAGFIEGSQLSSISMTGRLEDTRGGEVVAEAGVAAGPYPWVQVPRPAD